MAESIFGFVHADITIVVPVEFIEDGVQFFYSVNKNWNSLYFHYIYLLYLSFKWLFMTDCLTFLMDILLGIDTRLGIYWPTLYMVYFELGLKKI